MDTPSTRFAYWLLAFCSCLSTRWPSIAFRRPSSELRLFYGNPVLFKRVEAVARERVQRARSLALSLRRRRVSAVEIGVRGDGKVRQDTERSQIASLVAKIEHFSGSCRPEQ
ncbi:hypothetical protein SRHO_G00201750 [Serrasalmus rhombeus]